MYISSIEYRTVELEFLMPDLPVIGIIACLLPNFGIGYKGKLPWRLPSEIKFFKNVTTSTQDSNKRNAVIMGRKTWESIPHKFRPLPFRLNIIISRSFDRWNVVNSDTIFTNSLVKSINELKKKCNELKIERIFIIGGADIYNQSYELCDYFLITMIESDHPVEIDTFLNKKLLMEHFVESDKLSEFFSMNNIDLDDFKLYVEENGFKYKHTLFTRI